MKLYYYETPNGRKACATAKHLSVPIEYVRIDLGQQQQKDPEYLAINPNGKIPALTDGDVPIWESGAIMMYLAKKANSDMWPRSNSDQNEVVRWLLWDANHFSRHGGTLYFENVIKDRFGMGLPDDAIVEEALGMWCQFAGVLDQHLAGRKFLVGDSPSIADFAMATILPDSEKAKLPLVDAPEVSRWHERMMELPAWSNPWPETNTTH